MWNPFRSLAHSWNAFRNKDPTGINYKDLGYSYGYRPDRFRMNIGSERSIVSSVFNKIAVDISSLTFEHVRLDSEGNYKETINGPLNDCLTLRANKDQSARSFMQDIVLSMFDEGVIALVPIETDLEPKTAAFNVYSTRTGKIIEWYPDYIKVLVYNDIKGCKEEIILPKATTPIIENPFYSVMNEPNSTFKRLVHKLNILDAIDTQSGSGKMDLIIQVPYGINSELKREAVARRKADIESQLADSKYGIAYIDGTEHVTQLNRAVDNNLMSQIEYLTNEFYNQLGMTKEIFDGTASEAVQLNYYNSTVEPVASAIADAIKWSWLTKTARSQGQSIKFFRDPFRIVPATQLADIMDKLTRNEVLSSNEARSIIGYKPSKDPRADELRNKNISASNDQLPVKAPTEDEETE